MTASMSVLLNDVCACGYCALSGRVTNVLQVLFAVSSGYQQQQQELADENHFSVHIQLLLQA